MSTVLDVNFCTCLHYAVSRETHGDRVKKKRRKEGREEESAAVGELLQKEEVEDRQTHAHLS